jgi:hypothetical protein
MIFWLPARRRLRATQKPRLTDRRCRPRIVTGAAGDVWVSSAEDFCVAEFVVEALCDTIRRDTTMMTPPDMEAQILRFYRVEKWAIGTIARQLHIHNGVVRRVLAQAGLPKIGPPPRKSLIDAYLPFIRQTLEIFPTLTASRLYGMVRERGYQGHRITSVISSPATGRAARPRPIYVCVACRANRDRWTGPTSATLRLLARGVR